MLAMVLLCQGAYERGLREIEAALPEARERGDVMLLSRFLAYLTFARRLAVDLQGTRAAALDCLQVATSGGIREYIGTARANLAWVAWREADLERAAAECTLALEAWKSISFVYPFEWLARLVAIALQLVTRDPSDLAAQAARILDASQQLLPQQLTQALERLARSAAGGGAAGPAATVVAIAEQLRFL
jgi:hypothetical protein